MIQSDTELERVPAAIRVYGAYKNDVTLVSIKINEIHVDLESVLCFKNKWYQKLNSAPFLGYGAGFVRVHCIDANNDLAGIKYTDKKPSNIWEFRYEIEFGDKEITTRPRFGFLDFHNLPFMSRLPFNRSDFSPGFTVLR